MQIRTIYDSPIGRLTLASDGAALTGLWVEGQKHFGGKSEQWTYNDALPLFAAARRWLDGYFAGACPPINILPLALQGTPFQQTVWQLLCAIPYGETTTYGALAARIAKQRGTARFPAQAVGGAVGRNPISVIIPCHRVVGADGRLTGYAGGLERKKWLLAHEAVKKMDGSVSRQQ